MADIELVIKIPEKEFGIDIADKFQDFFKRLEVEIKAHMFNNTNLVCGAYELETIQMFKQALTNSTPLPKGHKIIDEYALQEHLALVPMEDRTYREAVEIIESFPSIIEADKAESEE